MRDCCGVNHFIFVIKVPFVLKPMIISEEYNIRSKNMKKHPWFSVFMQKYNTLGRVWVNPVVRFEKC